MIEGGVRVIGFRSEPENQPSLALLPGLIERLAVWKEIVNQFDFQTVTGTALGMVNAYQQHCADQADLANEECLLGLAWEAGNQTLGMLPGINTGVMILNGLKAIKEGDAEGSLTLGLGIFSIPSLQSA